MPEYIITESRGKNYIARIHKPILTAEERKAREEEVKKALIEFGRERMKKQYELS